jgi:predicted ATPase
LQKFEIADDIKFNIVKGSGSQVILKKDEEKINLVDLGFGVTQFLPIVLKIVYCNNIGKKTIVIEEPETNLHPKFQSKLADLFVDAQKTFGISFIIETHSEYLIRKLQYLTAKGDIKTEDTVVYYIGNPDPQKREPGEKQVVKIRIKENGQLSHPFGSGFYDEADNLALALLSYSLN